MRAVFIVGMGSFAGGAARFVIQQWVQGRMTNAFPFGTLAVNLTGCFLIGLIFSLSLKGFVQNDWRLFLVTGICGGYTTFSAFSMETITLIRAGEWAYGMAYVMASILLGLAATIAAMLLVKFI